MQTPSLNIYAYLLSALSLFTIIGSAYAEKAAPPPKSLEVVLDADNLLSIIQPKNRQTEEAKSALNTYYQKAIPLAQSFGYQNHGALRVTETVVGNGTPNVLILASWPNEAADLTFESQPQWQDYKALRATIWQELNFYKAPVEQATTLSFNEEKHYTIAFAWFAEQGNSDYRTYMDGIQTTVERLGGRFIHSMKTPRYVSLDKHSQGPDEITFVEWDTKDALVQFQQSQGFRDHAHHLSKATKQFELYRIKPVFR